MTCLAEIKKTQESLANSEIMLERTPELLETRFALRAASPHLRISGSNYESDPARRHMMGLRRNRSHPRANG